MSVSNSKSDEALTFATAWVAHNIQAGPFSWNDPPIYDAPMKLFRSEALEAGFSEADLEQAIGGVSTFIAQAYADATTRWKADQRPQSGH